MPTPFPHHGSGGFRYVSRAAGASVVVTGGLVFVGWTIDSPVLKSLIPGMIAMNPGGTALAFLLAGVSLWILAGPVDGRLRAVGIACAIGVVLVASLRLGGYLLGWDGGPDRLLFADKLAREASSSGYPNRMAPNTAAAMLLVGLSLIGIATRSRLGTLSAQLMALLTALISLLAIIGYAYSALALIGIVEFIPMALNTAIALAVMSAGILCARLIAA